MLFGFLFNMMPPGVPCGAGDHYLVGRRLPVNGHAEVYLALELPVAQSLNSMTCIGCYRQVSSEDYIQPYLELGRYPYCQACGKILKPDIILFEEQLPIKTWLKAEQASKSCDLMLVAGTSLEVMPSARLPMHVVENQASLIVVNKTLTYIDERAHVLLYGDVAEILPLLTSEVLRG